jgi:uncharacterized protein YndB with AHSA1/START domain
MTATHKTQLTRPSDHELVWSAWTDPAQLALVGA